MTLTTTMTSRRLRLRRANPARLDLSVDRIVLAVATSFCAFLFVQGGFEALLGAGAGAAIAARARTSPVSGALELMTLVAASGKAEACLARNYFRFTFARWEDLAKDGCTLEALRARLAAGGTFQDLLRETVLADRASIDAALAAGKISILSQTRTAYAEFEGKPAEGNGKPVKFKAKLSKGADGNWRLVLCELNY